MTHNGCVGADSGRERATCPSCGAEANAVRNPYYGAGLAVHELIVECPQCGVGFLDTAQREAADVPARRSGFGALLRALFGR